MLETRNLTIRFGGHVAVDRVSCTFQPGTLTAIVGPNGAGKTTFFNLISGQLRASEGSVHLKGIENVRLAVQARRKEGLNLWSVWLDHRNTLERAHSLVERVRLDGRADALAASLPHGDQRKIEVAMLMALEPSVYMFDEPTAGMSVDDVPVVLDLISALKRQRDKTILLVEHKMDVVRKLADRIIVLHNGKLVADGEPAEVIAMPVVQQAYLGAAAQGDDT
jgi:branched-chain amino acid transport system ATP-binding protein